MSKPAPTTIVVALGLLTLLLAFAQKDPCTYNEWQDHWQYRNYCYSDILPLWFVYDLASDKVPYLDKFVEYPVLSGAMMWAAASMSTGLQDYMRVTFVMLFLCGAIATWAIARSEDRNPWRVLAWSLSPALIIHAFTNWDLLAVALAAGGWLLWKKRQPFASALLFGLGGAAKLYPVLFLPPIFIDRLVERDWKGAGFTFLGGTLGFAGPNAIVYALNPTNWTDIWGFHENRQPDFETVWETHLKEVLWDDGRGIAQFFGHTWRDAVEVIGATIMVIALVYLAWRQWQNRSDPLWAGGVLVLLFLVVNKVYSPQYTLWALPVLVLLGRGLFLYWIPLAGYVLADLGVFLVRYRLFIPPEGQTQGWNPAWDNDSDLAVLLRWLFLVWLLVGIAWTGRLAKPHIEEATGPPAPSWHTDSRPRLGH